MASFSELGRHSLSQTATETTITISYARC